MRELAGEQLVAGGESEGCCLIRMVGVLASRLVEPLQGGCSHNENAGKGRAGRERGIPFEHYKGGEGFPFSITREDTSQLPRAPRNTKGYSSTYLAMGFANVRAPTRYPPEH